MENSQEKFDVAVIGGGPAGMIAAGTAAELGARVVLLEKNTSLGKKLLLTGKGRCNLTQAEFDEKKFIEKLNSKKGKFLFSSLLSFGPQKVIGFFETRGLPTKIERGQRVFPASDKSRDVLNVLINYIKMGKVTILFESEVKNFKIENSTINYIQLKDKKIFAAKFILATGGKTYPTTGSTGDGYLWAKNLGHRIIPPRPALVPLKIKEDWVKKLQGLSLKNVRLNLFQKNKKQDSRFGEMIFTHFGISGPIVLDVSKKVGELLSDDEVTILIDLKPALSPEQLDKRLQRDFVANINKDFKNYLPELIPQRIIEIITNLSGIESQRKLHSVTKEERKKMVDLLKNLPMTVAGLLDYDQSIITSGGVDTKEIDPKTMRSKIIDNLYFAGEIIDLDGPTGGYNLQISWSTGHAAGTSVIN